MRSMPLITPQDPQLPRNPPHLVGDFLHALILLMPLELDEEDICPEPVGVERGTRDDGGEVQGLVFEGLQDVAEGARLGVVDHEAQEGAGRVGGWGGAGGEDEEAGCVFYGLAGVED